MHLKLFTEPSTTLSPELQIIMTSSSFGEKKKKNVWNVSFLHLSGQLFIVKPHLSRCKMTVLHLRYFLPPPLYFTIPFPLILSLLANRHPSWGMCMSFAHTTTASCVYSINNIMKIALREGHAQDCVCVSDSERGARTVCERGVKGGMKWLGTNRMVSSMSSMSAVIEPMTYWSLG